MTSPLRALWSSVRELVLSVGESRGVFSPLLTSLGLGEYDLDLDRDLDLDVDRDLDLDRVCLTSISSSGDLLCGGSLSKEEKNEKRRYLNIEKKKTGLI